MISIIIPAFNRLGPLRATLASARAALPPGGELLLVDDGSNPPLDTQFSPSELANILVLRQSNQGSILARMNGLAHATQPYVLFLDSDDLIHPNKITDQIAAMESSGADVSTSDYATVVWSGDRPVYTPAHALESYNDAPDLFLRVQPAPHNPIYRRSYLQEALASPRIAPHRAYDPVGDVWLYYNLLPYPARLIHCPRPFTASGMHEEDRYSRHWEHLGLAALFLMEDALLASPPDDTRTHMWIGLAAFRSWRALPRDFNPVYSARTLDIWKQAGSPCNNTLGGKAFRLVSHFCGVETTARLFKSIMGHSYDSCRSLNDTQLNAWEKMLHDHPRP